MTSGKENLRVLYILISFYIKSKLSQTEISLANFLLTTEYGREKSGDLNIRVLSDIIFLI